MCRYGGEVECTHAIVLSKLYVGKVPRKINFNWTPWTLAL